MLFSILKLKKRNANDRNHQFVLYAILMLLLCDEIFEACQFNECSVTPLALAS